MTVLVHSSNQGSGYSSAGPAGLFVAPASPQELAFKGWVAAWARGEIARRVSSEECLLEGTARSVSEEDEGMKRVVRTYKKQFIHHSHEYYADNDSTGTIRLVDLAAQRRRLGSSEEELSGYDADSSDGATPQQIRCRRLCL